MDQYPKPLEQLILVTIAGTHHIVNYVGGRERERERVELTLGFWMSEGGSHFTYKVFKLGIPLRRETIVGTMSSTKLSICTPRYDISSNGAGIEPSLNRACNIIKMRGRVLK